MKTKTDPRHLKRIKLMQELFAFDFTSKNKTSAQGAEIIKHLSKIDKLVEKCAPQWPLKQINKIDLSILRLAIFELMYQKNTPPKVVVDEAIELGKQYGSESSSGFVNGVLGKLIAEEKIQT